MISQQVKIEQYLHQLDIGEQNFMQNSVQKAIAEKNLFSRLFTKSIFIFKCILDYIRLQIKFIFHKTDFLNKNIVFISPNLCSFSDNNVTVPLLEQVCIENILYINHSKEKFINTINNQEVYNIGGLVIVILAFFYKKTEPRLKTILAHQWLNDGFLRKVKKANVYSLCYYDHNGLSLAFSKYRKNFSFIEIQHGSMINFYPYAMASNFNIIDAFYVRNAQTIQYLQSHLAKNYLANYYLIPYPQLNLAYKEGIHILYASSIETNGFHDVFVEFLKNNKLKNLSVIVRLHPRELSKKHLFEAILDKYKIDYSFDTSKNWISENTIQNLIVVSPWSSIIEEAIDNDFKTIIIDEIGQKRFGNYIDNIKCFYSNNIGFTLPKFL